MHSHNVKIGHRFRFAVGLLTYSHGNTWAIVGNPDPDTSLLAVYNRQSWQTASSQAYETIFNLIEGPDGKIWLATDNDIHKAELKQAL